MHRTSVRHCRPTRTSGRVAIDSVWNRFQARATSPSVPGPPGSATNASPSMRRRSRSNRCGVTTSWVSQALGVRRLDQGSTVMPIERLRRSEEHTSELQSRVDLVCRLLLEKKKKKEKTSSNHQYE